jgi:DNA-binding PadR family transcriptional regulator
MALTCLQSRHARSVRNLRSAYTTRRRLAGVPRVRDFFYNVETMRTLGTFERAVLIAVMRIGDGAYGISIRTELEAMLRRDVSLGAVYTTLERLKEKGLVSSHSGDPTPQRGGRAKTFFKVLTPGRRALDKARRTADLLGALHPVKGES